MTVAALRVSVRKELRALLPMWAGCMLALGVFVLVSVRYVYLPFGILIYGLGSIGLGAHAIGHEYGNRTLGLWLSQPSDRRALLLIKLAVLAPLLVTLGVTAFAGVVPALNGVERQIVVTPRMGVLIALSALCIAPVLTILCRSGIAGMVFTLGVAGMVTLASEFVGGPVRQTWFWYTMLMVCALAAVVGWRQFMRLEAIESGGRDLQMPGFLSSSATATAAGPPSRNPIARLIAKELRLQQMTFVVAAMGLVTIAIFLLRRYLNPGGAHTALIPVTIVYAGALPLLIGALAGAEERGMGTLQWQLLMPIRSRTQFAVKVAVAFVLALVFALALPILIAAFIGSPVSSDEWLPLAAGVVLLTSASLYVSSLSTSSIRAVMMAMPSILVAFLGLQWVGMWISIWLTRVFMDRPPWRPVMGWLFGGSAYEAEILTAAGLALSALLLRYAHTNHRSAERPRTQVSRQVGWIAGAMVAGWVVLIVVGVR